MLSPSLRLRYAVPPETSDYQVNFGNLCEYLNRTKRPSSDGLQVDWRSDLLATGENPRQTSVTLSCSKGSRAGSLESKKDSGRDEWVVLTVS